MFNRYLMPICLIATTVFSPVFDAAGRIVAIHGRGDRNTPNPQAEGSTTLSNDEKGTGGVDESNSPGDLNLGNWELKAFGVRKTPTVRKAPSIRKAPTRSNPSDTGF